MNIKEAKQQIEYAVKAYLTRDESGRYIIPVQRQRPIFLMGPPGIGKTAIMEQVAQELGIGLVSYSMTHHTRQSAIGLPFIVDRTYGGEHCKVSEYTMSEIIASVYDMIEDTGRREGILFLDEVNCVSETLAPAMLQFLQYKIFGRHRVPDGWIVVTAGNPPEYNSSVREFDIVTWDRLKRVDVEPDFAVWREYGYARGVHPAILTYLEVRKGDFYQVETTAAGKRFVTARGWEDLSEMMALYERHGLPIDETLTVQYIQSPKAARDFAVYYDLFRKYRADYQVEKILAGKAPEEIRDRAGNAPLDERFALVGLILDALLRELREQGERERREQKLFDQLKTLRTRLAAPGTDLGTLFDKLIRELQDELARGVKASALTREDADAQRSVIRILEETRVRIADGEITNGATAFTQLTVVLAALRKEDKKAAGTCGKRLENAYRFCEDAFGEGQELLALTTELTVNPASVRFIGKYGSESYFRHNKDLLLYERQLELLGRLADFDLEELQ